ncbi:MAG: CPA2 family monovalent cation:H+ antiporter-2 [Kiritimatiellia bacterium]|jgi:CPA2 family monovalent cation:H+ antiporter-2
MHMDPLLPTLVLCLSIVIALAIGLRKLGQPTPVVYLFAGVLMGPWVLGLLPDRGFMLRAGEFGVILLLFFLGTEISVPDLAKNWRVPLIGTSLQIGASVLVAFGIGALYDWPIQRSLLLGFVVALSSTAVVLNVLRDRGEDKTPIGRDVISILLAQDLALAPMLIVLALATGATPHVTEVGLQVAGVVGMGALVVFAIKKGLRLPFISHVRADPEIRVFGALLLATVMALLSGLAHLSTAFGAFIGGLLVGATKEVEWVHHSLDPLRVLLVAAFLVAIGATVDVSFVAQHLGEVLGLAFIAMVANTIVNTLSLRLLGRTWRNSLYGGALLAQIGEFSFVLAAIGYQSGAISDAGHQLAMSVIAVTLTLGAAWAAIVRRLIHRTQPPKDCDQAALDEITTPTTPPVLTGPELASVRRPPR